MRDIFHAGKEKKFPVFNESTHCLLAILIEVHFRQRVKLWYVQKIKCWELDFVMTREINMDRACTTYERSFAIDAERGAQE
jgi:hypothetical protein